MPDEAKSGGFGTLTMNSDGSWEYVVDPNKIVPLDGGEQAHDSFTFTASDGSVHEIVMTVTGTEDVPVVSGIFSGTLTESDSDEVPASATGSISIADADTADTPVFEDTTVTGQYGQLILENGQWTYTLIPSLSGQLKDGDEVTEDIDLIATDGTVQRISIDITGSNTTATITGEKQSTLVKGKPQRRARSSFMIPMLTPSRLCPMNPRQAVSVP
ncbi:VCBS domain-containing protein [Veronia nyctiphanis]